MYNEAAFYIFKRKIVWDIESENKEYQRRKAGIRSAEQRRKDDMKKVMEKQEKIRLALLDNPLLSVRQLAKATGIPKSTVQRLMKDMF